MDEVDNALPLSLSWPEIVCNLDLPISLISRLIKLNRVNMRELKLVPHEINLFPENNLVFFRKRVSELISHKFLHLTFVLARPNKNLWLLGDSALIHLSNLPLVLLGALRVGVRVNLDHVVNHLLDLVSVNRLARLHVKSLLLRLEQRVHFLFVHLPLFLG